MTILARMELSPVTTFECWCRSDLAHLQHTRSQSNACRRPQGLEVGSSLIRSCGLRKEMIIHRHTAEPYGTPVDSCFYQIGSTETSTKSKKVARKSPSSALFLLWLSSRGLYRPYKTGSLLFLLGTTPSGDLTQKPLLWAVGRSGCACGARGLEKAGAVYGLSRFDSLILFVIFERSPRLVCALSLLFA